MAITTASIIAAEISVISTQATQEAYQELVAQFDLGLLQDDRPVPGDWVLIHVGFAMSKISECDALDQMNTLRALGEIDGAMQEVQGYGLEDEDDIEADDVETAQLKISDADLN